MQLHYFSFIAGGLRFRQIFTAILCVLSGSSLLSAQNNNSLSHPPTPDSFFSAALVNNRVHINWAGYQEENISHYIIEKSDDKISTSDVVLIFTADSPDRGASEQFSKNAYAYKDPATLKRNSLIHYRLKTVDKSGAINYSTWQTIYLNKR